MEAATLDAEWLDSGAPRLRLAEAANGPMRSAGTEPPTHILVVGDEAIGGTSISAYLGGNRFRVTTVADGDGMLSALNAGVVDLVVLALPPELGGTALLAPRLREQSPVPIIMLTTQRHEADRIMALELGADDCLTAPFSPRELLARVRALLRRRRMDMRQQKEGVRAYRFGAWELSVHAHRLQAAGGPPLTLTNGEFSLLLALLAAGGRTLSRMQLLELSRLHDDEVYERAVDMHVMRLRRKLETDGAHPRYLLTVRGAGYRIGVPVEAVY